MLGTTGLTSCETLTPVLGVASQGLVGIDVAEVVPILDPTNVTSPTAIRIIIDALTLHTRAKR